MVSVCSFRVLLLSEGAEEVERVREEIRFNNLAKDFLADKIKKQCWDTMDVHFGVLKGLGNAEEVSMHQLHSLGGGAVAAATHPVLFSRCTITPSRSNPTPRRP